MFKSRLFLSFLAITSLYMFQGLPGLAQMPAPSPSPSPTTTTTTGAVCGNHTMEPPEECDDGNTIDGDGCSSTCQLEGRPPLALTSSPTP